MQDSEALARLLRNKGRKRLEDVTHIKRFRKWLRARKPHAPPHAPRGAASVGGEDGTARGTWPPRAASYHYGTCAFVGSGHDLRCGAPRGGEIDGHEAVFRANAAQLRVSSKRDRNVSKWVRRYVHQGWVNESLLGARTTHRVNCLFGNSM